jgi:coproporphyrinogen III oxidase-like Fe-S oxidoreductase
VEHGQLSVTHQDEKRHPLISPVRSGDFFILNQFYRAPDMLLAHISTWMVKRRLGKIAYRFTGFPAFSFGNHYGIYVNIPFCHSRCTFCPFYKELYREDLKNRYVAALAEEIKAADISGTSRFIYFGGGTPNVLSIDDLAQIVAALRQKVSLQDMGIELSPALLTPDYLRALSSLGFSKISIGIQSFSASVTQAVCRSGNPFEHVSSLVSCARAEGLRVNLDLLFGLPSQSRDTILRDFELLKEIAPDQISLYPLIVSRGQSIPFTPALSAGEQLALIEEAEVLFSQAGYTRKTIWVFARDEGSIYDTSGSEIDADYRGFGAGAYSVRRGVRLMNPDVYSYIAGIEDRQPRAFVAGGTGRKDEMRRFSKMLYSLGIVKDAASPFMIRLLQTLLEACSYTRKGHVTEKGRMLAHLVSKTVMEELPFPLLCHESIVNYQEYADYRERARGCISDSNDAQALLRRLTAAG